LAGIVQEVVSRPGWTSGNSIAFLINGTGHRTADSFDKTAASPARLNITYASPTPLYTASATVLTSANDAEQYATGPVSINSTDLELVNDAAGGAGDQIVGVRFENLALAAGVILATADIQFAADETQSEVTALTVRAQAADNAAIFTTTASSLSARPLTSSSVVWSPAPWTTIGERGPLQRTPDLAAIVREVIARPGWASGNAMAFLISGTGHRTADAADKAGGSPATLTVNYWPELPLGSYLRWAGSHTNIGSITADLDGDGYNNLFEYALSLDPAVADHDATPLVVDATSLYLTYVQPAVINDVTYQVEWADALDGAWSSAGVTRQILSDDGTRRTIRATAPKGATDQRFVRLKITR
jgi:hypothetical protein